MGLPWVRLDSNIATHDKVLTLLEVPRMGRPRRDEADRVGNPVAGRGCRAEGPWEEVRES